MLFFEFQSQSQECLFEKVLLNGVGAGIESYCNVSQDAAKVSKLYLETHNLMTEYAKDYIPSSWIHMTEVKSQYFNGLAHYYATKAILDQPGRNCFKYSL